MPDVAAKPENDVEISVGPHSRRKGWRVVRVTYRGTPEQARRVARALAALTTPADAESPSAERPLAELELGNAVA
jgi:hypothetical protein